MKQQSKYFLHPTEVSALQPVFDAKGCITEWGLTVTFNNQNIEPPHAKGARVTAKVLDDKILAEYKFSESVLNEGIQKAWIFREAILKQIARQNSER